MTAETFRVNQPKVVFESFGDETVLVNLDSGFYYSLQGCGGRVLACLEAGYPPPAITEQLSREYSGDVLEIEAAVGRFLADLQAEAIIVPGVATGGGTVEMIMGRPPFAPPTLEKFSDMQDLLLLDPIHEVDEMGWPHAPAPHAG